MTKPVTRVAVTGGCGQIAYSLLFRIASGEMFGKEQPVALHILEIPAALDALKGVVMELEDCAFPLLQEVRVGSDPKEIFRDVNWALLIGAKPRGPGMERSDLLKENGKIFIAQGQALNEVADRDVKVVVVGNPCNTNALIAMHNAPQIPRQNFHAMTRLDQNRAVAQLAVRANVPSERVSNVTIWGNHSATQVPDAYNARIDSKAANEVVNDAAWLDGEFVSTVQKRGAAIIAARGKSSAASAANALLDSVRSLVTATKEGEWFSTAVCSDGNSYGVKEGLIFSFPCRSKGDGNYEIVRDVPWNDFLKEGMASTEKELLEERELVSELIKPKAVAEKM